MAFVAVAAPSCAGTRELPPTPRPSTLGNVDVAVVAPTTSEAAAFARTLADLLERGDFGALDGLTDARTYQSRVWSRIPVSPDDRHESAVALQTLLDKGWLFGHIFEVARRHSSVTFMALPVRTEGALTYAPFRALIAEHGVNWSEFLLTRTEGGVRIADLHDLGSGEWVSTWNRREFVALLAEKDWTFASDLPVADREWLERSKTAEELVRLARTLDVDTLQGRYQALPQSIRTRASFVQEFAEAGHLSTSAVVRRRTFDWARDLSLGDVYANVRWFQLCLAMGDRDEALASLDRLSQRVSDPYLDVERGRALLGKGMPLKAWDHLERALAADPSLDRARALQLEAALELSDMRRAVLVLEHFQRERAPAVARPRVLAKLVGPSPDRDLSPLLQSGEYASWLAGR